jgi:hypothetical protein
VDFLFFLVVAVSIIAIVGSMIYLLINPEQDDIDEIITKNTADIVDR